VAENVWHGVAERRECPYMKQEGVLALSDDSFHWNRDLKEEQLTHTSTLIHLKQDAN
jgi:hypothetical protein